MASENLDNVNRNYKEHTDLYDAMVTHLIGYHSPAFRHQLQYYGIQETLYSGS
jgi:hypothetical protein